MTQTQSLRCDGCGQAASPEHIARRLQRLEWSTRFRPVHIGTLLLGASSPQQDAEFLYAPEGAREGEARFVLEAVGIEIAVKSVDALLIEFQRGGFFLTHVLECPVEEGSQQAAPELIECHLLDALTRIRRSLRPKRLVPSSSLLQDSLPAMQAANLSCAILLDCGKPFALEHGAMQVPRLRELLVSPAAARSSAM